ncbi:MAG: GNAT family N-acetyltransferase [Verrucomicrobiaceae bacterium]|nr:MAG: GNAT family N-acetyltransferase [Verrucomicrobiaceae bacterium]
MKLVPASVSDQDALFALHEELFRHHIEQIWGWDDEWQLANFHKEWDESLTELILHDGQTAGYIQTREEPDHLYLLGIAIDPACQGKGIGTAVMRTLQQRASLGRLPLRLSVFRTNARVIAFYQRLAFAVESETETGCVMRWEPT